MCKREETNKLAEQLKHILSCPLDPEQDVECLEWKYCDQCFKRRLVIMTVCLCCCLISGRRLYFLKSYLSGKKTKVKLQKEISSHCLAKQVEKIACVSLVADMMVGVFKVMYCCFSKVKMQNRLVKWENVVITLRL